MSDIEVLIMDALDRASWWTVEDLAAVIGMKNEINVVADELGRLVRETKVVRRPGGRSRALYGRVKK